MDQSTGLFDASSQMFLMSVASLFGLLGMAVIAGLSYQLFIYVPRTNKGKNITSFLQETNDQ